MYSRIFKLLYICFLTSCVTVVESVKESEIDPIAAANARVSLGLRYLFNENWSKAKENLEIALSYAPNYYHSLNSIAYYYQQVEETDLADKYYKKALRQSPNSGDVLNNYGVFLCELGQYSQAEVLFTRAIEQEKYYRIADSYENAALCALQAEEQEKATYYFERCLDYDPNRLSPMFELSKIDFQMGEIDKARDRLVKIHKKFGYQRKSLQLLIHVEQSAGNAHLADEYIKQLEARYPSSKDY
ncbi:type IV pilus biogenesis/stability protein PilW [Vibrio sp. 99-8-1]|uniref:type IV pilus biogenesis/stability protein PilW n=1 Tax=Vibrio sp. 99-8-1 TaxID=2607602 RepID=UPI00149343EB|nr:type IV pilus biogenesis/stability protein PilW [Vibrio sp. 99-8-1]NOI67198.1 type IV pilus biogenesis/stability protein PilW [Vibrio sp. 99-8-1]